jgi:hypothetical protein
MDQRGRSSYQCSKTGWINEELLLLWLQHFAKHSWRSPTVPLQYFANGVFRLRAKQTASRCGGQQRIGLYWISSRGQPTRGGSPSWEYGVELTTLYRKMFCVTNLYKGIRNSVWKEKYWSTRFHSCFDKDICSDRVVQDSDCWILFPLRYLHCQNAATSVGSYVPGLESVNSPWLQCGTAK